MRVYRYTLEFVEPALVNVRPVRQGYEVMRFWLPGSTVRGGYLSELYRSGNEEAVKAQEESPMLLFSPAYPIAGDETESKPCFPAHPYIYSMDKRERTYIEAEGWVKLLLESGGDVLKPLPGEGARATFHIVGQPVYRVGRGGNRYAKPRARVVTYGSVGIDKKLRKSSGGMVYTYQAIPEGSRFWGLVISPGQLVRDCEIYLGRGVSRGFGRARLKIEEFGALEDFISRLADKPARVLYAFSPVAYIKPPKKVSYIPPPLEGRKNVVIGSRIRINSWFRRTTGETGLRPAFMSLSPGSVILTERPIGGDALREMYSEENYGMMSIGYNYLLPLHKNLRELEVKLWSE